MHDFFTGAGPLRRACAGAAHLYASSAFPIHTIDNCLNPHYLFKFSAFNDIIHMIWEIGCGKIDQDLYCNRLNSGLV